MITRTASISSVPDMTVLQIRYTTAASKTEKTSTPEAAANLTPDYERYQPLRSRKFELSSGRNSGTSMGLYNRHILRNAEFPVRRVHFDISSPREIPDYQFPETEPSVGVIVRDNATGKSLENTNSQFSYPVLEEVKRRTKEPSDTSHRGKLENPLVVSNDNGNQQLETLEDNRTSHLKVDP
ncbi:hypothetical protein SUNI508_06745 [Seiridium unicorne]|uniref:Uncharacterized protein n=1 Tax=Seiridium unicorne TaxID=138068 RepID=A0ABR2V0M7_9PEZI